MDYPTAACDIENPSLARYFPFQLHLHLDAHSLSIKFLHTKLQNSEMSSSPGTFILVMTAYLLPVLLSVALVYMERRNEASNFKRLVEQREHNFNQGLKALEIITQASGTSASHGLRKP